jgi:hypothetical protein
VQGTQSLRHQHFDDLAQQLILLVSEQLSAYALTRTIRPSRFVITMASGANSKIFPKTIISKPHERSNSYYALGISLQTLRNHLHYVNEKLGTHSRLQAVMHAMHHKLL